MAVFAAALLPAPPVAAQPGLGTAGEILPDIEDAVARVESAAGEMAGRLESLEADIARGLGWFSAVGDSFQAGTLRDGGTLFVGSAELVFESLYPRELLSVPRTAGPDDRRWIYSRSGSLERQSELWVAVDSNDRPVHLTYRAPDGLQVDWFSSGYEVRLGEDPAIRYGVYQDSAGHGELWISPPLAAILTGYESPFGPEERLEFLESLRPEAAGSYSLRVRIAALREAGDLQAGPALGALGANLLREIAGLPPWRRNEYLEQAAEAHSRAVVTSGLADRLLELAAAGGDPELFLEFHTESPDMSGFTGRMPWDRARAAGYPHGQVGENGNFGTDLAESVAAWFFSVYHRRPWLRPDVTEIGIASYPPTNPARAAVTMKYGFSGDPGEDLVVLPAPGEVDVPYSWNGIEAPDPLPDRPRRPEGGPAAVGPPISVFIPRAAAGAGASVSTLSLYDEGGGEVDLVRVEVWAEESYYEAVVAAPLEPDSEYRAVFTSPRGDFSWEFHTAPAPAAAGRLALLAGQVARAIAEPRAVSVPSPTTLEALQNTPLSFEPNGASRSIHIEPYDFELDLPTDFEAQSVPSAPGLLRLQRSSRWGLADVVFHRLGDLRDPAELWNRVRPGDWHAVEIDVRLRRLPDGDGNLQPVVHGRRRLADGGTGHVLVSIVAERGVSLWTYGLEDAEVEAVFARLRPGRL